MTRFLEAAQARALALHEERLRTTRGLELEEDAPGVETRSGGAQRVRRHRAATVHLGRRALRLRAEGLSLTVIAERFSRSVKQVEWAMYVARLVGGAEEE